jgi:SNF2 family DNA or RNA helicase
MFLMIEWPIVIVDEAQNIKNPDALRTKTLKKLGDEPC